MWVDTPVPWILGGTLHPARLHLGGLQLCRGKASKAGPFGCKNSTYQERHKGQGILGILGDSNP